MNWQEIVKQNNLNVSIITLKQLNLATRIDAEHYQAHFLEIIDIVKKKNNKRLAELVTKPITTGHTPSMQDESYYGGDTKFIKTDNLRDNIITEDFNHYLSDKGALKLKNALLQPDDVIVTIIGANYSVVGRVARVFVDLGKSAINQNISLIRPKIKSGYLTTFLTGKYGKQQLYYLSRQTEQVNLNNVEVADVIVPIPSNDFEEKIHNIHTETHNLQLQAKSLYSQAEALLLSELGLFDYIPNEANTSIRDLFECLQDDRFDAEYWMPKYDEMQKRVASVTQGKLEQIVHHKKGVEVGSDAYQEEGEDFIRVSDFNIFGIEGVEKKISEELYENLKKNYQPKKGEVLFTKDGTIGLSYAVDEDIKGILSGAFLRLQPKTNINVHYLALVLNSLYCKYQIERMSGGAIIAHLKPDSAMKINIPILAQTKQDELGDMVIQSLQKRKEAKDLLDKAKRAVELFIEEDEETALRLLR
ncbi:MAG: dna methylase-type i restriction-modification system [candidate division WWE3 bacterium GW2011_GWB1_47_11]|uniref:Dna methylase-type i restriction-modification system n=1 Tax=candidate division WWE3 bacterium GW2011_GWB1_47_11 TaxID=1619117 RepID=A0A0G1RGY3_UNCKA|nr:MAG: dna methylase-type i restriction-modification system [candidate division WWE3 bacterium GW2011_GWB1_47_11]